MGTIAKILRNQRSSSLFARFQCNHFAYRSVHLTEFALFLPALQTLNLAASQLLLPVLLKRQSFRIIKQYCHLLHPLPL
jgi:hypothetical protein